MSFSYMDTNHALTVKTWENKLASEYLDDTFWMHLSGPDDGAIIQTKNDLMKTRGDKITFGIRSEIIGGRVDGANQGEGNEGRIEYYDFGVTVDITRQLVKKEHMTITDQRSAFGLMDDVRPALSDKNRFNLEDDITNAMADTSLGRVRGRYLYGSADSNWNATHATALANVDATNDMMSTTMIEDAKLKAEIPTVAHAKIRPWKVMGSGPKSRQHWYVMVMHKYNARDMVRHDAAWKNAQLNIPPGTHSDSPIYKGQEFLGAWDGVVLYSWERIPIVASTINVSHCFFLGAQAGVLAWAQFPKFGHESKDVGHTQIFETAELRSLSGMKVVYDRNTVNGSIVNEDNGVVHVFAAAVA